MKPLLGTPSELFHGARRAEQRWPRFHSTFDIIAAAEKGLLPDKIMINTHPQRWTDDPFQWTKELILQNCKNLVKRGMIRFAKDD